MQVTACDNILYVEMFTLIVTQHTYKLYNIYLNGKQKKNLYSTLPEHKSQKKKKKKKKKLTAGYTLHFPHFSR